MLISTSSAAFPGLWLATRWPCEGVPLLWGSSVPGSVSGHPGRVRLRLPPGPGVPVASGRRCCRFQTLPWARGCSRTEPIKPIPLRSQVQILAPLPTKPRGYGGNRSPFSFVNDQFITPPFHGKLESCPSSTLLKRIGTFRRLPLLQSAEEALDDGSRVRDPAP